MIWRFLAICLVAAIASTGPAAAFTVPGLGLTIDLPEEQFVVRGKEPPAGVDMAYTILAGPETPSLEAEFYCQVNFTFFQPNNKFSQQELNVVAEPIMDQLAGEFSQVFAVQTMEVFTHRGVKGHQTIVGPLGRDVLRVRMALLTMDTPPGRTAISCAGPTEKLETLVELANAILDGVTPPP